MSICEMDFTALAVLTIVQFYTLSGHDEYDGYYERRQAKYIYPNFISSFDINANHIFYSKLVPMITVTLRLDWY